MPTTFYARYVPKIKTQAKKDGNTEQESEARPAKRRRKKDDNATTIIDGSGYQTQRNGLLNSTLPFTSASSHGAKKGGELDHHPSGDTLMQLATYSQITKDVNKDVRAKKGKKPKTLEQENSLQIGKAEDDNVDDKHKTIREKYKQASQRSEAAANGSNPLSTASDEDILEVVQPVGLQPLPQPKNVQDEARPNVSVLPGWMAQPVHANSTIPFADLGLSPEVLRCLSSAGFETAFAVQAAVISMLQKRSLRPESDICVSASTGSGKTLAYTLPIIEALRDKPVVRLRALIIVPTRELVNQVEGVFRIIKSALKVGTAVGSRSMKEERKLLIEEDQFYNPEAHRRRYDEKQKNLQTLDLSDTSGEDDTDEELPMKDYVIQRSSRVDVLICTPGRLVDHIRSTKGFTLEHVQWLVVDEADRLLDQSFQEWIDVVMPKLERKPNEQFRERTFSLIPQRPVRKIILSATMTRDHSKLLALNLNNPKLIVTESRQQIRPAIESEAEPFLTSIPEHLTEFAVAVKDSAEKPLYLIRLIESRSSLIKDTNGTINHSKSHQTKENGSPTYSASEPSSSDSDETGVSEQSSLSSDTDESLSDNETSSSDATSSSVEAHHKLSSRASIDSGSDSETTSNYGFLIFVNTNESALRLCRLLAILRPSWASRILPLTKSVGSSSGRKALAAFRKSKADLIVATDLASRGLDLRNLAHVINYDLPKSLTTYIHRVGRTARAGHTGIASTLVSHHEARWFWEEIGQSAVVERKRKVTRKEMHSDIAADDRSAYEEALRMLGQETKGELQR